MRILKYAVLSAVITAGVLLAAPENALCQTAAIENVQTSKVKEAHIAVAPEDMFIDIQLPGHQIYAGEMIRVENDVYVASKRGEVFYDVEEPDFLHWYSIEGATPKAGNAVFNGKSYKREPFAVYYATPVTTGKVALPTLRVQVPFNHGEWITHVPSFVEVLPLPTPSPAGFAFGNVGQFEISTVLSSHEVKGGEIITVMVHVKGNAPVAGIRLAPYTLTTSADAFRLFPVINDEMKEEVVENQVVSTRSFRFRMEALKAGNWTIDPFEMVVFNPKKGQYETLKTVPLTIHVSEDAAQRSEQPTTLGTLMIEKRQVEKLSFKKAPSGFRIPIHVMWIAPFVLICLAASVIIRKRNKKSKENADKKERYLEQLRTFESTESSDVQLQSLRDILTFWFGIDLSENADDLSKALCAVFKPEDAALLQDAHRELKRESYSTRHAITGKRCKSLADILRNTTRHGGR